MAKWERKETGNEFKSVYHECSMKNLRLRLIEPSGAIPWRVNLVDAEYKIEDIIIERKLIEKSFRLYDGPQDVKDLEKAQDMAFNVIWNCLEANIHYWANLKTVVETMDDA